MKKHLLWWGLLLFCYAPLSAQLTVQDSISATQLANTLAGSEINVFNAVLFDTTRNQSGTFSYVGNDLGLNTGIILSNGDIHDAIGPNSSQGTWSYINILSQYHDTVLKKIVDTIIWDYVALEFEFEAPSDVVEFDYVFLSEEYNEIVGSIYNDAFAFTISGPGIVGEENLALVPNTTAPITINTVNLNSYWQYYNDNDSGDVNIEFDGFTSVMTARKTGLQPCSVYKLSLKIADGGDKLFDSAVMLQANSLRGNTITVVSSTYSTDTTALEGCSPAHYTFDLGYVTQQDLNIPIRLEGSALNGVDYEFIDSFITIPAGQSSSTIIIDAYSDGLTEGRESVALIYRPSTSICIPRDTVILYIDDAVPISYTATGTNLTCPGDSSGTIMLNIQGGSSPYTVVYGDTSVGLTQSISSMALPVTGLAAETYSIEVYDQYGCTADVIVSGGLFNAGQTFLPDGTGVSYTNDINITGFNVGQRLTSINQINAICATLEHSYAGDLSIELVAPNGATIELKGTGTTGPGIYAYNLGEPIASGPTDAWSSSNLNPGVGYQYCWTTTPTYGTMNSFISPAPPGPPPTYTYTTLAGNTYTDYYLPAGSYAPKQSFLGLLGTSLNGNWQLKVTDNYPQDNGYLFDWSISLSADLPDSIVALTEPTPPTVNHTVTNPTCGMADGAIDLIVSGGFLPYTYQWSNGDTDEDITGLTAGTYFVTVTGTNNCEFEYQVDVSNTGAPTISANISDESCYNAGNGAVDISVGVGSFTYNWSNGAITEDINTLLSGVYTVTVTDGSCLGIEQFQVNAPNPLLTNTSVVDENCGDREGEIDVTLLGGTGPFSYAWSNGATTQDVEDLQQGWYVLTTTDANMCSRKDSFLVINLVGDCIPSCDLAITSTQLTDESCLNASGSISLTTYSTGGTVFYQWTNGSSSNQLTNLSAGNYSVTISDTRGCEIIENYNITNQTNGFDITNMLVTNEYCNDATGTINPHVLGGTPPYTYLWSNGATTSQIQNLVTGLYTCTVTDANGCRTSRTDSVGNDVRGDVRLSYVSVFDATCNDSTGSIDLALDYDDSVWHGGTYLWSNGSTTLDQRELPSGSYSFTFTETGAFITHCTYHSPVFVVGNQSGNFNFNHIDVDHEICGNGDGEILLTTAGGANPIAYTWSTGGSTASLQDLSTGVYSATVTDSLGCTIETGQIQLGNTSGDLKIDALTVQDEICGNRTGAVSIVVSGNIGALSYQWNNGSTSPNLVNLSAGQYTCTITDASGCSVVAMATVNNNVGNFTISIAAIQNETCSQQNGSIDLHVQGGDMPYSYLWSSGNTLEDISGLSAGTYQVTVSDNNGCEGVETFNITNNTGSLSAVASYLTNEVCNNNGGAIDIIVNGTQLPFSYVWSNGSTNEDIQQLAAGSYNCTVTDASGCQLVLGDYTINNSSDINVTSILKTNELCNQGNGAIDISVTGGVTPYTYSWSTGQTTQDINNLTAGAYTCTITDSVGCLSIIQDTISSDLGNFAANVSVNDERCSNNQGSVDVTVQGGSLPYGYIWSNGATTEDIVALNANNYTITITDADGCSIVETYTVSNNAGNFQLASVNATNETCGDNQGGIDVNLFNGQAPFTYNWSTGATTQNLSGLAAGIYTQTISDNNGCTLVHSVHLLNDPGQLQIVDTVIDASCGNANGLIALTAQHGQLPISYQWTNGSTTTQISGLLPATYQCQITDAAGCSINYSKKIDAISSDLSISNISVEHSTCNRANGSALATVTGGEGPYSYSWSSDVSSPCSYYILNMYNSYPAFTNVDSWQTSYYSTNTIRVSINNAIYGYFTIPQPPNPSIRNLFNQVIIPICQGDSISFEYLGSFHNYYFAYELLNSNGDMLYQEYTIHTLGLFYADTAKVNMTGSNGAYNSRLVSGNYTLTVTDANGCTAEQTVAINNTSDSLQIQTVGVYDETCSMQNGSIDIEVSGLSHSPPVYSWSTGDISEDLINLSAGTYTITISDRNGCSASSVNTVMNNTNGMYVSDTTLVLDSCSVGNASIDITLAGGVPPYSYAWNTGTQIEDIANLSEGLYSVTITDSTGCNIVEHYYLSSSGLIVNATQIPDTCFSSEGQINLSVSGGTAPYTYQWSNGSTSKDIDSLFAGEYTCTIMDAAGCVYILQDTVSRVESNLFVGGAYTYDTHCYDSAGGVFLSASGDYSPFLYEWSNGATTENIMMLTVGDYSVTITDQKGCVLMDSFEVGLSVKYPVFYGFDTTITPELCSNDQGSIDLTPPNNIPFIYSWSTGATTQNISGLSTGIYTVTISNYYCNKVLAIEVPHTQGTFELDTLTYAPASCNYANGSINLNVSGGAVPYTFSWSNGETTEDISGLRGNQYTFVATDVNGCELIDTITIPNLSYGLGLASSYLTDAPCGNDGAIDVVPAGGTTPYTYSWSTGETTEDLTGLSAGTYYLTLTESNGCSFLDSFVVNGSVGIASNAQLNSPTCQQANGAITVFPSDGVQPYTYLWTDGNTTATATGLSTGVYDVTITDANSCSTVTSLNLIDTSSNIQILTIDTIDASCSGCNNGAIDITLDGIGAPYNYAWSNGENVEDISGLAPGVYDVTITNVDGCQLDTSILVSTSVGVNKVDSELEIKLYPNPNTGQFIIEFSNPIEDELEIQIFNTLGQVLLSKRIEALNTDNQLQINLEEVATGTYLVRLSTNHKLTTKRVIIRRE